MTKNKAENEIKQLREEALSLFEGHCAYNVFLTNLTIIEKSINRMDIKNKEQALMFMQHFLMSVQKENEMCGNGVIH